MSVKKASSSLASKSRVGFTPTGGGAAVTISNVIVTDSSWNNLDDTAVGTSSSYIKIIGSGFVVNPSVYIGTTQVSSGSITFVSSTELRVVLPSLSLGTQNLFVFNTDYSGAIWSAGLVVSGFPDYTQTVYTSLTPLSVSVQLLATGDTPLTYALQGGSSLPAGTSLSSSGLITGTTTDGTYQFTVIVSDAQNQSFQQQLTLTISSTDEYFNRTTLAINGDVNTFVSDGSTNNFPITINGDTKPSAFSPYNTNWSNFFDGTGDYLSVPNNAAFDLAGGDFTIECWVYPTTWNATAVGIFGKRSSVAIANQIGLEFAGSGGTIRFAYNSSGSEITVSGAAGTLNAWQHIAVVRNGSTLTIYKDGVSTGTATINVSITTNADALAIGVVSSNGSFPITGYITNFRIVKGTAVYTSAFTPSTTPLTAITNTSLLTCKSNRFIDNSTNAFTITKAGDTKVSAFGPFTETDTTTGSTYFDGTGDYLTTPSNTAFYLATGDYTVEAFVYKSASGRKIIVSQTQNTVGTYHGWLFYIDASDLLTWEGTNSSRIQDTTALTLNTWFHVAAVRSSGTTRLYKNGVQVASGTVSITNFAGNLTIGQFTTPISGSEWSGYISNLRIVNGTSLYTSTFTPPTSPLTAIANTSLLTLQTRQPVNNHTFIDVSGNNNLITRTGNASQGSFSPFSPAGWSNYFDGSGDILTLSGTSATNFNGVDWTFECWFYKTALSGGNDSIIQSTTGTNNWIPYFGLGLNNNFTIAASINAAAYNSSQTYSLNTWNHIAMVRSGGVVKVYLNGAATSISVTSDIISTNLTFWFGKTDNVPGGGNYIYHYNGYLSNLRLVKGTAVYTSNFTPSTTPLTAIANTQLLILRSNTHEDDGPNNFAITKSGDVKIVPFSPFKSHTITANTHSVYFDGSGDYLTSPSSTAFTLGSSGDFTIECWFYLTASPSNYAPLMTTWTNASNSYVNRWGITFYDGKLSWYTDAGNLGVADSSNIALNTWIHVAVVRNGSTITMYKNGVALGTQTTAQAYTTDNTLSIGYIASGAYITGYISNARIVKGTAVYTSAFTPPTSQLTAVSNTQLLTCQTSTLVDNSTNLRTIVPLGNVHVKKFNPFGESIALSQQYIPATHQGSVYLDGSDYLAITASNLALSTSDFEISFYLYLITNNGYLIGTGNSTGSWAFNLGDTTYLDFRVNNLAAASVTSTSIPGGNLLGQWVKVRIERISNVVYLWVNEKFQASATVSTDLSQSALGIGSFGQTATYASAAYIADLEIRKGSRSSSSTHNLMINMPFNHGGIVDVTGRNILECVGDAKIVTSTRKYGTGSMSFDGTGDYISLPSNPLFAFGTGDFTIEAWVWTSSVSFSTQPGWIQTSDTAGGFKTTYTTGITGYFGASAAGSLAFNVGGTLYASAGNTIVIDTWYHMAVTRASGTVRVFVNGNIVASGNGNNANLTGQNLVVGGYYSTSYLLNGYIDDLRITRFARYTANFTPPTSTFLAQ